MVHPTQTAEIITLEEGKSHMTTHCWVPWEQYILSRVNAGFITWIKIWIYWTITNYNAVSNSCTQLLPRTHDNVPCSTEAVARHLSPTMFSAYILNSRRVPGNQVTRLSPSDHYCRSTWFLLPLYVISLEKKTEKFLTKIMLLIIVSVAVGTHLSCRYKKKNNFSDFRSIFIISLYIPPKKMLMLQK
jgi:hypothetical protein